MTDKVKTITINLSAIIEEAMGDDLEANVIITGMANRGSWLMTVQLNPTVDMVFNSDEQTIVIAGEDNEVHVDVHVMNVNSDIEDNKTFVGIHKV